MILDAARLAFFNLFARETRSVFWKVLGLTILVLIGLWFVLRGLFMTFLFPWIAGFFPGNSRLGWLAELRLRHSRRHRPCLGAWRCSCRR